MSLQVRLHWAQDAQHWSFTVPALHIVGGGCATREEAERHALEAVEFALESQDVGPDPDAGEGEIDMVLELPIGTPRRV